MTDQRWMIYGANGYTGTLIAREAARRGLAPVLAGRSLDKVGAIAAETSLAKAAFSLTDTVALRAALKDVDLVLHCAGPFSATAQPMIDACLDTATHYLDITGEIDVFEAAQRQHQRAAESGVVLCPGAGFDVIPTDCVAATLKEALPDATELALGFDSRSGFSPGTAKTSVEGLAKGGRVRRDGVIVPVPLAYRTRTIDFGAGEKLAMTIPWGDVSTAYYSTDIGNIEVYIPASPKLVSRLKSMNSVRPLLGLAPVQWFMKRRIDRSVRGPDAETREKLRTHVWGEVRNAAGDVRTARVETTNGYSLTVTGSLELVRRVLAGETEAGTKTPSQIGGADLVSRLPDCSAIEVT